MRSMFQKWKPLSTRLRHISIWIAFRILKHCIGSGSEDSFLPTTSVSSSPTDEPDAIIAPSIAQSSSASTMDNTRFPTTVSEIDSTLTMPVIGISPDDVVPPTYHLPESTVVFGSRFGAQISELSSSIVNNVQPLYSTLRASLSPSLVQAARSTGQFLNSVQNLSTRMTTRFQDRLQRGGEESHREVSQQELSSTILPEESNHELVSPVLTSDPLKFATLPVQPPCDFCLKNEIDFVRKLANHHTTDQCWYLHPELRPATRLLRSVMTSPKLQTKKLAFDQLECSHCSNHPNSKIRRNALHHNDDTCFLKHPELSQRKLRSCAKTDLVNDAKPGHLNDHGSGSR